MSDSLPVQQPLPARNGNFVYVKLVDPHWVLVNPEHIMTVGLVCGDETKNRPMTLLQLVRSHIIVDHRFEDVATFLSLWEIQEKGGDHE